jgi:hypothetical protein
MAIDLGDMPKGTPPTPQQQAQIRSSIGLGSSGSAGFSSLVLTGQSITGTAANSLLDMATTWNTSGIPSAIKLNVNDVASNAASNLLDLQVGGSSKFKVDKVGLLKVGGIGFSNSYGIITEGGISVGSGATFIAGSQLNVYNGGLNVCSLNTGGIQTTNVGAITWGSGTSISAPDLYLSRRAAANLRVGAADAATPVAQTLSVQSVVAGTTNSAGTNFTIDGSQGTGTGAGGSIIFRTAKATTSSSAVNSLTEAMSINSNGLITLLQAQTGTGGLDLNGYGLITSFDWQLRNVNGFIGLGGNFSIADTRLYRDAAAILALRNGGVAQTFRLYNTYTDATTFERLNLKWDTNVLKIGTEKGSVGGTGRALKLEAGAGFLNFDYDGPITLQGAGEVQPIYIQATGNASVHVKSSGNQQVLIDSANANTGIRRSAGASTSDTAVLTIAQTSGSVLNFYSKTNSSVDTEFSILGGSSYLRRITFGGSVVAGGMLGTDVHIKGGLAGTNTLRCGDVYLYGMSSLGSGRSGNVILQNDSSAATNGNVGIGNIAPLSKLDISDTWNSNISVTGASGTGTVATITFAAQTTAIAVGSTIVVASVNPAGYNGTFVVTASSLTSVSYANATTAAWISGGNIQQLFTAIKLNVTDTASNANSLLMDLHVGGATRFKINKLGQLDATSGDIVVGGYFGANRGFFVKDILSNQPVSFRVSYYGSAFYGPVGITGTETGGPDVIWMRDDAGILAQRNGLNAQTFRLYNTYTNATTFERLNLKWDTNVLKLGTEKGSVGGAARDLVLETNSTERLRVLSTGNIGIGIANPAAPLDVYYTHGINGGTQYGFRSIVNGGSNNANVAGYFSATNGSSQVAIRTGTGSIDFNGTLTTNGNIIRSGNIFIGASPSSTQGNLQIGDAIPASIAAGLGGLLTFSGDAQGQGNPTWSVFASIRGIKENGAYQNSLGAIVFGTQNQGASTSQGLLSTVTEKMRISSSGNLGIGTAAPISNLEVVQSTTGAGLISVDAAGTTVTGVGTQFLNTFKIGDTITSAGQTLTISAIASDTSMTTSAAGAAIVAAGYTLVGGSILRVQGNGRVGVGSSSPTTIFDINDNTGNQKNVILTIRNGNFGWWTVTSSNTNSAGFLRFSSLNSARNPLTLDGVTGNVGIEKSTPTAKLDISDINLSGSGALAGSALNIEQTWNTTGTPTAIKLNVTDTASNASSNLLDLQVGGVSRFKVTKNGGAIVDSLDKPSGQLLINSSSVAGVTIYGNTRIQAGSINFNAVTYLHSDAANTLDQRNAANAQTFRLYNTYTDATTFERLNLKWDTNVLKIGTEKGSVGGAARSMELQTDGTTRMTVTSTGDVGIGTATPQNKLDVNGDTRVGGWLHVDRTGGSLSSYLAFKVRGAAEAGNFGNPAGNGQAEINFANVSGLVIGTNASAPIIFATQNLERLRILGNNGNVGIGTTTPSTKLEILTSATGDGIKLTRADGERAVWLVDDTNGIGALYLFNGNNNNSVYLTGNGDSYINGGKIGIGITTPTNPLHVYGTTADQGIILDNVSNPRFSILRGGTERLRFNAVGNIGTISAPGGNGLALGGITDTSHLVINSSGNIGIGTIAPTEKLDVVGNVKVSGHFSAATKSFLIDHPTKAGKKLQYGVVESNQHSVLVRGKTAESIIELPEEWAGLVHEDSVTVQLTPIDSYQSLFVISQDNKKVIVGGSSGQYNYTIYGERKDVDKLVTEI